MPYGESVEGPEGRGAEPGVTAGRQDSTRQDGDAPHGDAPHGDTHHDNTAYGDTANRSTKTVTPFDWGWSPKAMGCYGDLNWWVFQVK